MRFHDHLSSLRKGERNVQLVSLMLRGLGEGKPAQGVVNDIHSAHPDLTENELRHAMNTAESVKTDRIPSAGELRIARAVRIADTVEPDERDFVERMVSRCPKASSADLMKKSPIDLSTATPKEQALAYIATVFPDDRHFVFTADEDSKFMKRTYDTLRFPSLLFKDIADGANIPNYAIANQFSGQPAEYEEAIEGDDFDTFKLTGGGSFACMATLATHRLALLEFDELPLADQARFWVAVIEDGAMDGRLRTLVYSGTKSIHALIRMNEAEITGHHMDKDGENFVAEWSDDPVAKWKAERARLSRMTEYSPNPMYRADKACKDPTRLTRFAGATRISKDGRKRIQTLLWCANPDKSDIPTPPDVGITFYTKGYGLNGEYYKC